MATKHAQERYSLQVRMQHLEEEIAKARREEYGAETALHGVGHNVSVAEENLEVLQRGFDELGAAEVVAISAWNEARRLLLLQRDALAELLLGEVALAARLTRLRTQIEAHQKELTQIRTRLDNWCQVVVFRRPQ